MRKKGETYRLVRRKKPRATRVLLSIGALVCCAVLAWLLWEPGTTTGPTASTPNIPPVFTPAPAAEEPAPVPPPAPTPIPKTAEKEPAPKPPQIIIAQPKPAPLVAPKPPQPPEPEPQLDICPRPVRNVLEAQIALARQGISSGPIDGLIGSQTRAALSAFQQEQGLQMTGELDQFTKELLLLNSPPLTNYVVSSEDVARLQPLSPTWLGKSQQSSLDFENILELVAEKCRAHPNYLRKLNPGADWANVAPGAKLIVPDAGMPIIRPEAAFIRILLSRRLLQVFDSDSNLLAHFPCSIAQRVEKRPAGELHITAVAPDPNYTFDPSVFPESEEARSLGRKLILPPGPNNPVGIAWISLDMPGYGIHGTPQPEQVGRTESHGCFRLANWNAAHLLQIVRVGMPVYVQEN